MNFKQLRNFVTIVDAGSISRAAQLAHIAQPALSQQIAELEEAFGVTLLQRSARGVRATAAGERLYAEARAILRRVDRLPEIVRNQGDAVEGNVRVGMSSTLAAIMGGPMIAACAAVLPMVRLQLAAVGSARLAASLREHTHDLILLFEDDPVDSCVRMPLFHQRLFLVRRANGAIARSSITVAELADIPLVLPYSPNVTRAAVDRALKRAGIEPHVAAELDLITGVLTAVQAGVGDTILPLGRTDQLPSNGEFVALAIEPPLSLTASLVSSGDTPLTAAGEAVRDFMAAFVARFLQEHPIPGAELIES
ncbi:LysR substrate-binding domain-containing protein [Paraburkholderia sp. J12]|uniref:LysR substrate-binding domain-containing protein n=1 Tax=Paraburkholderia sp. J12 TaxID=2805432 RepID=UPI002ABDDCB8|nr:LysR substrate-binding domain-containing protein [Paraburkholderia sp. J12]